LHAARKEIVHRFPQFLPDGRHFIYCVWSALEENTGEYIGSLDAAEKLPEGPLVRTSVRPRGQRRPCTPGRRRCRSSSACHLG
jgi:hypothetical protein